MKMQIEAEKEVIQKLLFMCLNESFLDSNRKVIPVSTIRKFIKDASLGNSIVLRNENGSLKEIVISDTPKVKSNE